MSKKKRHRNPVPPGVKHKLKMLPISPMEGLMMGMAIGAALGGKRAGKVHLPKMGFDDRAHFKAIDEIARMLGYEKSPASSPPSAPNG